MELSIRWVRSFVAVYEQGHFGHASRSLYLTPSAVSKHISNLERELGSTLFVRGPGSTVAPTVFGDRFSGAAAALLAAHDLAVTAGRTGSPTRTLRLGVLAGVPFTAEQLAFVRAGVALRCPGWQVVLRRIGFSDISASLEAGVVDVLWTGEAPRTEAVSAVRVGTLERVGIVGRHHALAEAISVDAQTFADQPLLFNPQLPVEWMDPFCLHDVRAAAEARLTPIAANSFGAVIRHVGRGTGVMVSATPVPPGVRTPVVTVRLTGLPSMNTHAAFRAGDRREIVDATVATLADTLRSGTDNGTSERLRPLT